MKSKKDTARLAGFLYLIMGITGAFGIMYVPSQIIVSGDALVTANNINSHEMLYRFGIVNQLICQTVFIYLVLTLNNLFRDVSKNYANQMVALVVASVPIAFLNMVNQIAALVLLSDAEFLSSFSPDQINALVMLFFKLYENGTIVVQIFWGLWLIPFGILAYRSGFIPRLLGILLILGGIGYVIASLTGLLYPMYVGIVGSIATIPSAIGEISIIVWLLIKGVSQPKSMLT